MLAVLAGHANDDPQAAALLAEAALDRSEYSAFASIVLSAIHDPQSALPRNPHAR
jgi:hypothetical protein